MHELTFREYLWWAGAQCLRDALERNEYCAAAAARELDMNRTNFYRVCTRHGVNVSKPVQRARRMTPEFRRFLGVSP